MAAGPEWMDYLRAFLALLFVAGLIFFLALGLRKTGLDRRLMGNKGTARLGIIETLYLDPRHRLVIVRHDGSEHLILIGTGGDLLISSVQKSRSDAA
jgi:flagellar protein FliO/FliZ